MSQKHLFSCECSEVKGSICLSKTLSEYSPRECDCDFCSSRGIKYLSEPDSKITVQSKNELLRLKQGSNQAEFLTCSNCNQVIAASLQKDERIIGALNSSLLEKKDSLGDSVIVSPKALAAKDKVERWDSVWCSLSYSEE